MTTVPNEMLNAIERRGILAHRGENGGHNLADVTGKQLVDVRLEQEHDQDNAAHDRHREEQLQRRFGDELHHDQRPIGGGQQRSAFERGAKWRGVGHC